MSLLYSILYGGSHDKPPYDIVNYNNGIIRKKGDHSYEYSYVSTKSPVTDKDLQRIKLLKIPPAWTNVWISRDTESPIQATGYDSKGRKQYKYHLIHIGKAEKQKFIRLSHFSSKIEKFRKKLIVDAHKPLYEKDAVVATMLLLVYDYYFRVGKEIFARENKSYGISSMRKKHVKIINHVVHLKFKGKSNQRLDYVIKNQFYVNQIMMLLKLEGDRLFQYTTTDRFGKYRIYPVSDKDLNDYIKNNMGDEFTIKDFRTYGANFHFIRALLQVTIKQTPGNSRSIKKNLIKAITITAKFLKHTKTISKKSYVNNYIIDFYQNHPDYFVRRKDDKPEEVMNDLLHKFIKEVINETK